MKGSDAPVDERRHQDMEQDTKTEWASLTANHDVKRDAFGWTLRTWTDGMTKEGAPKRVYRDTYHGKLEQVCMAVVDQEAGKAREVEGIVRAIDKARREITKALNGMAVALQ